MIEICTSTEQSKKLVGLSKRHFAKFKEGDWIVGPNGSILHIEKIDGSRYYFAPNQKVSWGIAECDSKSHLWTIKDAKKGDILSYRDGMWIFLFSEMVDQNSISYIALLSEDGALTTFNAMYTLLMSALVPATPAQRDALLAKLSQKNYIWDKKNLTLKESESETTQSKLGLVPIFKAGDRIKHKLGLTPAFRIDRIEGNYYIGIGGEKVSIFVQDNYELTESSLEKASKEYSFNIESTLFQTIPVDLRELWKKEIENAFCSGAKWKEKYGK
jgi:hypothetical protein